jgi:hypothetical protein
MNGRDDGHADVLGRRGFVQRLAIVYELVKLSLSLD